METPLHIQSPPRGNSPKSYAIQHQRPQSSFAGSARIGDFDIIGKLGEGTFGEVHRATTKKKPGQIFALKKILMHNEKDGFPITALREIKLLKLLRHQNIVRLDEVAVEHDKKQKDGKKRSIMYMVMPYMDHDLCGLLENPSVHLTESSIKCYMLQLLEGVRYLHDKKILHRDMKAANLLINNKGILQIADFGLARHYDEPVPVAGRGGGEARRDYTTLVVTRWYRPPELLLQLRKYTTAIDLWGVGCVFGEMLLGKPILPGESDALQLKIIFDLCGNPTEDTMPGWDSLPGAHGLKPFAPKPGNLQQRFREHGSGAISLLKELLKLDWRQRINAIDALNHPYFKNDPKPSKPEDIPQFEESHELDRKKFRDQRNAIPAAPKGGTVGMGPDNGYDQNNSQGYQNGDNYRNHHNGGERRHHHHSNGVPPPPPREDERRKPAWARPQHNDRQLSEARDPRHTLPPRPPVSAVDRDYGYDGQRSDRDRDPRRAPPRGGGPNVDTYIPNYNHGERPPRSRDGRPPPRDRERDRDDYRRRDSRDRGLEYDEGPRATRTRSRSPVRERERDHRERSRDWDRDDRRDPYRR